MKRVECFLIDAAPQQRPVRINNRITAALAPLLQPVTRAPTITIRRSRIQTSCSEAQMPSRSRREALSPRASSTTAPPAVALGTTSNKTWSSTSSRHHASQPTSLGARKTTGCSRVIRCTMPRKCATTGAPRWCTTRSHRPRGTSITTSSWPQVSLQGCNISNSYRLGRSCITRLARSR